MWDSCSFAPSLTDALLSKHLKFDQRKAMALAFASQHYGMNPRFLGRFLAGMYKLYGPTYWGEDDKNRLHMATLVIDVLNGTQTAKATPYPDSRVMEVYGLREWFVLGELVPVGYGSVRAVMDLVKESQSCNADEAADMVRKPLRAEPPCLAPDLAEYTLGGGKAASEVEGFLSELAQAGPPLPSSMRRIVASPLGGLE
jgi:hypothetical protein